jgi:hypothetical protein
MICNVIPILNFVTILPTIIMFSIFLYKVIDGVNALVATENNGFEVKKKFIGVESFINYL